MFPGLQGPRQQGDCPHPRLPSSWLPPAMKVMMHVEPPWAHRPAHSSLITTAFYHFPGKPAPLQSDHGSQAQQAGKREKESCFIGLISGMSEDSPWAMDMANNPTTAARGISFHVPSKEMGHREPAIFIPTAGGTGRGQAAPTVPKSPCLLHTPKGLVPRPASPLSVLE